MGISGIPREEICVTDLLRSRFSDADKSPQLLQELRRSGLEFSGSPQFITQPVRLSQSVITA